MRTATWDSVYGGISRAFSWTRTPAPGVQDAPTLQREPASALQSREAVAAELDATQSRLSFRVEACLHEYEATWQELLGRWENQRQAFNYLVVLLGAVIAALASGSFARESDLCLSLPWLIAPFAFMYFDNELMIWTLVQYNCKELRPRLREMLGDQHLLMLELNRFNHISVWSARAHVSLSAGRWLVFLIPMTGAVFYGFDGFDGQVGYAGWSSGLSDTPLHFLVWSDCIVLAYFVAIAGLALAERLRAWHHMRAHQKRMHATLG